MKYWLIVRNNLKKSKITTFTLILLVGLATALIITSVQTFMSMDSQVSKIYEGNHSADTLIMQPKIYEDAVDKTVNSLDGTKEVGKSAVLYFGDSYIKRAGAKKRVETPVIMQHMEQERKISSINLLEKSKKTHNNGIYVNGYLKYAEGFKLGDKVQIHLEDQNYEAVIDGFYQDVMFPSPSCVTLCNIYAREDVYSQVESKATELADYTLWLVKCDGRKKAMEYETDLLKAYSEQNEEGLTNGSVYSYKDMNTGITMFPSILMGILLGFSVILMIIAIVVIRFEIVTYIQQNYKNLGVMEASGYTSRNLMAAMVAQFSLIAFMGTMLGVILTGVAGSAINNLLRVITGLKWNTGLSFPVISVAVLSLVCFVALVTLISARKLKKISVLMALRDGINTHNFRKNHFPLEHSRLPLNLSLGVKSILTNRKQNLSILLITAILTFAIAFSITAFTNFSGDSKSMRTFIGIEKGEVMCYYNNQEARHQLTSMKEVDYELTLVYLTAMFSAGDKEESLSAKISDDFSPYNKDMLLEGRYPEHENEISLTQIIAKNLNVGLNDTVRVTNDERGAEFLVVGITQQLSNMGRSANITYEGALKIQPTLELNGSQITLKEGTSVEKFIKNAYKRCGKENVTMSNLQKMIDDTMQSYEYSMKMLCIGSILITTIVIALVMFLLVSIKVLKERRNLGVNKAIGYTTGQLMIQMIVGFVPSVAIGSVIGVIMGVFLTNPVTALSVSAAGISKCNFSIPYLPIILVSVAIVLLSLLITAGTSFRIRKITPSKMVTE